MCVCASKQIMQEILKMADKIFTEISSAYLQ